MNRLQNLRKEQGLSQQSLTTKLNNDLGITVTLRTLQNWEADRTPIKSEPAQVLADYFGVSVAYLLGYSDYRNFNAINKKLKSQEKASINDFVKDKIFSKYLNTDDELIIQESEKYDFSKNINSLKSISEIFTEKHNDIFSMYYAKAKTKPLSKDDISNLKEFLDFFSRFTIENADYDTIFQDMLGNIEKSHSKNLKDDNSKQQPLPPPT